MEYNFSHVISFPSNDESNSNYLRRILQGVAIAVESYRIYCKEDVEYMYVGNWTLKKLLYDQGYQCYYTLNRIDEIIFESAKHTGIVTLSKIMPQVLLKKQAGARE